jgi:hypothetical protein
VLLKERRRGGEEGGDLFAAYLARQPERDPRVLLPRSVLPVARGAVLMHGVVAQGWSLGWLAAFLFAEFFLVVRLAVLGDRFSTGPQADPEHHRRTSLAGGLAWLGVAVATTLFAGQALDRSTRGSWFGFEGSSGLWAWPGWGIVAYLALLVLDFVAEALAARRERRMFVPAGVLQATLFFVAALLLSFVAIFISGIAQGLFGERGVRGLFAAVLVLARAGGDLAVLWLPHWEPRLRAGAGRRNARSPGP